MREYLKRLPKETLELISEAGAIAGRNNMPAYLVGGFVRDLLLGVKNFDLDIVIEGDGIKFAEAFASRLKAKLIRHSRFGTATIIIGHELKVDIASARKEFYPQPGHLPVVSRGSLKEDLFRRDFTINAMAVDIGCDNFGKLIDFFSGKSDLENGKIRILHELSFEDDPTRILRSVRFEQRYGFKIEPKTLKLLREAVKLKMLEKVQPQRTRDELILMLKESCPVKEIRRLQQLAGFNFINGNIKISKVTYGLLSSAKKEISWFRRIHQALRPLDAWLIYLMALLDSLDPASINRICRSFAFRRGEEARIISYKKIKPVLVRSLSANKILPSRISSLLKPLSYETIIMLKAGHKNKELQKNIEGFFKLYNNAKIHVSGHDLRSLGIEPGPRYQKIFNKVLAAKLDGKVVTKEEELILIAKLVKRS